MTIPRHTSWWTKGKIMLKRMMEEKEMERLVHCSFGYVATRGGIVIVVGKSGESSGECVTNRQWILSESVWKHGVEEGCDYREAVLRRQPAFSVGDSAAGQLCERYVFVVPVSDSGGGGVYFHSAKLAIVGVRGEEEEWKVEVKKRSERESWSCSNHCIWRRRRTSWLGICLTRSRWCCSEWERKWWASGSLWRSSRTTVWFYWTTYSQVSLCRITRWYVWVRLMSISWWSICRKWVVLEYCSSSIPRFLPRFSACSRTPFSFFLTKEKACFTVCLLVFLHSEEKLMMRSRRCMTPTSKHSKNSTPSIASITPCAVVLDHQA